MKTIRLILLLGLICNVSCNTTVMRTNTLNVQGNKLRKTVAYRTQILQVGNKITRGGPNMFVSYDLLKVDQMPVTVTTSMKIDEVSTWLAEIGLDGVPKISEAKGSGSGSDTEKGTFVVVAIQNHLPFIKVLQDERNRALIDLLLSMRKPRIVTAVATTLGQESDKELKLDGTLNASLTTVGLPAGTGKLHVNSTQKSNVKFSDGTVFAYELSIPAWSRDAKGRLIVADYVEDRPGWIKPKPMVGTYLDPKDVP